MAGTSTNSDEQGRPDSSNRGLVVGWLVRVLCILAIPEMIWATEYSLVLVAVVNLGVNGWSQRAIDQSLVRPAREEDGDDLGVAALAYVISATVGIALNAFGLIGLLFGATNILNV